MSQLTFDHLQIKAEGLDHKVTYDVMQPFITTSYCVVEVSALPVLFLLQHGHSCAPSCWLGDWFSLLA